MSPLSPAPRRVQLRSLLLAITVGVATLAGSVASVSPAAAAVAPNPAVEATICGEPGAAIVRLYRAYFDREPDRAGLEYWGQVYLQTDMKSVAFYMSQSPEFINRWADRNDEQFIEELLYGNLLKRSSDAAGIAAWLGDAQRVHRSELALYWVQAPELIALHPVVDPAICDAGGNGLRDIPGGRAMVVDVTNTQLKTSSNRCSVASINANWLHLSNGQPIGFSTIDGKNGSGINDSSRGILGLRSTPDGAQAEFSYGGQLMLSNLTDVGDHTLQLHSNLWITNAGPYDHRDWLDDYRYRHHADGWRWAVGGITLVNGGQEVQNITSDTYTFNTRAHSFAAFRAPSTVIFGSTTDMNTRQLINWLTSEGYTDIMKMDGGGSVEFNEYGTATVAGTARPIPVWLGVGC